MHAIEIQLLRLLVAGVVAILVAAAGIAAVMAWMPTPTDMAAVGAVRDKRLAPRAKSMDAQARAVPAQTKGDVRIRMSCAQCGAVTSKREIGTLGTGIDAGAAGPFTRTGRNELAAKLTKRREGTVRMKVGPSHMLLEVPPENWRPGERAIVIEGMSQSSE
jgi:hypothetical protein